MPLKLSPTFLRFLGAGGLNTFWGWAMYAIAILLQAPVWLALIVAIVAGIAFNFFTIGGYAFKDMAMNRLPRFIAAYGLLYVINLLLLSFLTQWVNSLIWAQCMLTLPLALLSYLLMSCWVFKDATIESPDRTKTVDVDDVHE